MNPQEETFETWNKLASLYEEKFMHLTIYNETYDYICRCIIKEKANILEIGCGPGNITKHLLSLRPDFNILGTDMSPNMIELAEKNNPQAKFRVMNADEISILQESFDGIISGFCIPYLSETETKKLIQDSYSLLNENGLLYLSFVEGSPEKSGFLTSSTGLRTYFYYHQEENTTHKLEQNQFKVLKSFRISYKKSDVETEDHIVIIARKENNIIS